MPTPMSPERGLHPVASWLLAHPSDAPSTHWFSSNALVFPRVLLAVSLILLSSCARNNRGVVAISKEPSETSRIVPEAPTRPAELPAELRVLVTAIDRLPASPDDRAHTGLVRALRALAEVVQTLAPASADRAALIEAAIVRLQRSATGESSHAEHVRTALDHALAAMNDAQHDPVDDHRRRMYVASIRAWHGIAADQPLLQQRAQVHLALMTITNALAVTRGLAPPFAGASTAQEHRPDLDAFVKHTRRADELTSAVAAARSWTSARKKAAETLQALADAVTSSPAATRDAGAHAMIICFEATRLERASVIDQRRVDWTKAGLLEAVNALEAITIVDAPIFESLSAAAARAVQAIDPNATFAFQRPAIQDALRAVVSAYRAAAIHEDRTRRRAAR